MGVMGYGKVIPCLLRSGENREFREIREFRDFPIVPIIPIIPSTTHSSHSIHSHSVTTARALVKRLHTRQRNTYYTLVLLGRQLQEEVVYGVDTHIVVDYLVV